VSAPRNTDLRWPELEWAEMQLLRIQTKIHRWANDDPDRRFDDLFGGHALGLSKMRVAGGGQRPGSGLTR
jgi:hypothetical protein